jgi:hypothetical protein
MQLKRIALFCGSSAGQTPFFMEQATLVGETLAERNIELVYGGAQVGLMGAVANGALQKGGKVIGVIPHFLKTKEIAHPNLTQCIEVHSMHERKTTMNELCDGVIALPGGFGTLEELFEMLTWLQLGLHQKPIGILNLNGFYDALITLIQTMVNEGFLKAANQELLLVDNHLPQLLEKMERFNPPQQPKWITKETL